MCFFSLVSSPFFAKKNLKIKSPKKNHLDTEKKKSSLPSRFLNENTQKLIHRRLGSSWRLCFCWLVFFRKIWRQRLFNLYQLKQILFPGWPLYFQSCLDVVRDLIFFPWLSGYVVNFNRGQVLIHSLYWKYHGNPEEGHCWVKSTSDWTCIRERVDSVDTIFVGGEKHNACDLWFCKLRCLNSHFELWLIIQGCMYPCDNQLSLKPFSVLSYVTSILLFLFNVFFFLVIPIYFSPFFSLHEFYFLWFWLHI